jgi:hypothetical protein
MTKDLELEFVKAYVNDWDNFDAAKVLAEQRDLDAALNLYESLFNPLGNIQLEAIAE